MNQSIDFLRLFNHKVFTLAYFDSKKMRSFPCNPDKLESAIKFLQNKNTDHEIYFMVNEGNGVLNSSKTACHSTKNVVNLSSIFLDAEFSDNSDPLPAIDNFCKLVNLPYSIIVNTSKNRYHVYWLISPCPATPENVLKWQQIQSFIHSKLSSDKTMTDIPQILRIPGFNNVKKDYPITFESTDNLYNLDTIYNSILPHFTDLKSFKPKEKLPPITDSYTIPEGERHEELLRRAKLAYSKGLSDSEVKCFMKGVLIDHTLDYKIFLNGGSRASEYQKILQSAKSYHEQDLLNQAQVTIQTHVTKIAKQKNPFELPPEFFYNTPGLVGSITRYFIDNSNTPIYSHAFAAACSLVGLTKARYIQGIDSLPPLNYFLCLAPSGSGKTTIQHMLKNILTKLNITYLQKDGIPSAQGLLKFLSKHGLGLTVYDEVRDLFQTISSKNAATYESKISTELTTLYTAYKSHYSPLSAKGDKSDIVIHKPLYSFLGFGQHTLLDENLFTKNNVTAGLLPRFIILPVNHDTRQKAKKYSLPDDIIQELTENVTKSNIASDEKSCEFPLPPDSPQILQTVQCDPESQKLYNSFEADLLALRNASIESRNGLEAFFSRGNEQVLRLALTLSTHQIQAPIMQFCIDLVRNQINSFYDIFDIKINTTDYAKEVNRLYDKIIDSCQANNVNYVPYRTIRNNTNKWFKHSKSFDDQIKELIEQEKITIQEMVMPSGRVQKQIYLTSHPDL